MNVRDRISGWVFAKPKKNIKTPFERLFEVFKELIIHTSGDFDEAIDWLRELDNEYKLTTPEYTIENFIEDLLRRGYIQQKSDQKGKGKGSGIGISAKTEKLLREYALKQIFGQLQKSKKGNHKTSHIGNNHEDAGHLRPFEFGDSLERIEMTESIKNAQINSGLSDFHLRQEDLVVQQQYHSAQMSTVLMIDISHSMILYGEDRITPAKKVALALSELILTRYPKDTLDILVFGNDARPISLKDLPYLEVGPFHTNTVAGLELAMDILRRKKGANKQIFMITDGKPSCLKMPDGSFYKNSVGLDEHITEKCFTKAKQARKLNIPITTFMIASDPYLQRFIKQFTAANQGKAFYTGLDGLGEMIFEDYEKNRKKRFK